MGTFTSVTTASHRYYMKRPKSEIVRRIRELEKAAGLPLNPDVRTAWTAYNLASYAMSLHRQLPE